MENTDCREINAPVVEIFWQMVERELIRAGFSYPDARRARLTFQNLPWKTGRAISWEELVGDGHQDLNGTNGAVGKILEEIRAMYRLLDAGNVIEGNAAHSRHLGLQSEIMGLREDIAELRADVRGGSWWFDWPVTIGLGISMAVIGYVIRAIT